jgi:hypothetical protein
MPSFLQYHIKYATEQHYFIYDCTPMMQSARNTHVIVFNVNGDSSKKYHVSGGNTRNVRAKPMNLVAHQLSNATIACDHA